MDNVIRKIVLFLLICLVFFPETSVNTALAIKKESIYSIYLYRAIGVLTLSDLIVLFLAFFVFIRTILRGSINFGVVAPILYLYFFYYILGALFNIFIAFEPKGYLFDIKAGLYLFIPYMALKEVWKDCIITESLIIKIVVIYALGVLLDAVIIGINGGGHYVSQLSRLVNISFPIILEVFPISLMLGMFVFFSTKKIKSLAGFLLVFEFLSTVNRLNLGVLVSLIMSLMWLFILKIKLSFRLMVGSIVILYYTVYVFLMTIIIFIQNPLTQFKADGWGLRKIEIYNFLENAAMNFPILIGKGLGATWKEIVIPASADVYSHGSFYDNVNNFIFHNTLGGSFYKFGIIGSLFIITYLAILSTRVLFHTRHTKNESVGAFLSFSIPAFVMLNINGIGVLKGALICSLILFSINRLLKNNPL
jgi:hypothetical protein